jgi:phosphoribosylformylglycinamidine synthase
VSKLRFGVIIFPGSNGDHDALHMLNTVMGQEAEPVWHGARQVRGYDALVLPGGFSYGDYLRCGAIARFAPVMDAVRAFAAAGGPVLGICNGFQILTEAHLLPGALLRNGELRFTCRWVQVRTEPGARPTPFLTGVAPGTVWRLPIAHGEGRYYADPAILADMEAQGQIVLRYCGPDGTVDPAHNPNGSTAAIAGVCNAAGNVLGLMPHPENLIELAQGGVDGQGLFRGLLRAA